MLIEFIDTKILYCSAAFPWVCTLLSLFSLKEKTKATFSFFFFLKIYYRKKHLHEIRNRISFQLLYQLIGDVFLFFHIPSVLTACYLSSYIITSSFSLQKLVFSQARVTDLLLSDNSSVIIK